MATKPEYSSLKRYTISSFHNENSQVSVFHVKNPDSGQTIPTLSTERDKGTFQYDKN
jgi:hypothetical protein